MRRTSRSAPSGPLSPNRGWLPLGALALIAISVYAGAKLRDAVGVEQPIPKVRPAAQPAALTVTLDPPEAVLSVDGSLATTLPRAGDGALCTGSPHDSCHG